MKIIKSLIFIIFAIFLLHIILLLYNSCEQHRREKEFLDKYEYEDFSQFKGVNMEIRGYDDSGKILITGRIDFLKNDSLKFGEYILKMDTQDYSIPHMHWICVDKEVELDTIRLKHLAQTFMKYKIAGLYVDTAGNVFVYIKDFDTRTFVRFANEDELQKGVGHLGGLKLKILIIGINEKNKIFINFT